MAEPGAAAPGHVGPVVVRLPPDPALSRVLRLASSGIAAIGDFSVDEIDDIKIAVSEVLLALIEHGDGHQIDIEFTIDTSPAASGFTVSGSTVVEQFDSDHPDLLLCRRVLAGVCSAHGIDLAGGRARIWASVARAADG